VLPCFEEQTDIPDFRDANRRVNNAISRHAEIFFDQGTKSTTSFPQLPTDQRRLASNSSMEAKLQASIESLANLIYVVRLSARKDLAATMVYLDMAEEHLKRLADSLEDRHSTPD
jgi:hypothetical protein